MEARAKDGSTDKLTSTEFLKLVKTIQYFINECENLSGRKSPSLKLVLEAQSNKFATRFHDERKKKLNSVLDIEQWKSNDHISIEFQDTITQIIDQKIKIKDLKKFPSNVKITPKPFVLAKKEKYSIVNSVITMINMVLEYCQCSQEIQTLTPDLLTRLFELLKQFNVKISHLVLGAGAIQIAGLKTITARNLILSSRCLRLVTLLMPHISCHFEELLYSEQKSMCKQFDDMIRAYNEHISQIPEKIINLVKELADAQLTKWEAKPPVPSPQFQTISQHLLRLHDNIQDALPAQDLAELFRRIHEAFKEVLREHLERLKIKNDGGPQHGLVITYHNVIVLIINVSYFFF